MQAETLNCPMCGAASSTDSTVCAFCNARLATTACPNCFGMMFTGAKYCSHCGTEFQRSEELQATNLSCPRCRVEMKFIHAGPTQLVECSECTGLWVDVESFEKISTDQERQSAVLGAASAAPTHQVATGDIVRYIPCPQCKQLMNRINFARCSGVIVDVCKGHGTWFDRDELSRIVDFIRKGGLDAARNREKAQLEEEKRAFEQEKLAVSLKRPDLGFGERDSRTSAVGAARDLLRFLVH